MKQFGLIGHLSAGLFDYCLENQPGRGRGTTCTLGEVRRHNPRVGARQTGLRMAGEFDKTHPK